MSAHLSFLQQLILIRLLTIPKNLAAAKSISTARRKIRLKIENDLLKLLEHHGITEFYLRNNIDVILEQYTELNLGFLQLSNEAKQMGLSFLGISGRRVAAGLTWEQVRNIHFIAKALALPTQQRDRVKSESKLQATILAKYYTQLIQQERPLALGTLGQVARELARLAIGAKSSKMTDLKQKLIDDWLSNHLTEAQAEVANISASDAKTPTKTVNVTVLPPVDEADLEVDDDDRFTVKTRLPRTPKIHQSPAKTAAENTPTKATTAAKPAKNPESKATETKTTVAVNNNNANSASQDGLGTFVQQVQQAVRHCEEDSVPVSVVQAWKQWQTENQNFDLDLKTFRHLLQVADKRQLIKVIEDIIDIS